MPMQPLTDATRGNVTAAQVLYLLQNEPSIKLTGGLEIVDINLNVQEDIKDDLAGGTVQRDSYANLHGSAQFRITRQIDWGGDLLRPYIIITGGGVFARFNLGVYHPTTPAYPLDESPPTFEVDGFDILLRLAQPVGDAYSIAAGTSYLAKAEEILLTRGYTQYIIDQSSAATAAPANRVWAFDDQITWLTIVNDLLGSIGYAGIWSDWNGRLRLEPYQNPIERVPEWYYSDDATTSMLSTHRSVERDYFSAPNRWVIYRSNLAEEATPVEGNGIYTYVNQSVGDTSVDARRGLTLTHVEGVDVANQASLIARAQQIIDADMQVPTNYITETSPNPLHWHFDRLLLQDSSSLSIAEAMCTQWALPLPPDVGDMQQQWRILGTAATSYAAAQTTSAITQSTVSPPPPPTGNPKVSTLTENWQSGIVTATWPDTANLSTVGWRAKMTIPAPGSGDAHVSTDTHRYDLTNSSIYVFLPVRASGPNSSHSLQCVGSLSPENRVFIGVENNNLLMRKVVNGTVSDTTVTYDPWSMFAIQLRHDGTNVYWETSTNGITWTTRRTDTIAFDLTSVFVQLQGTWWTSPAGASSRVEWGPINLPMTKPLTTPTFPPTAFGSLVTLSGSSSSRYSTTGMREAMQEFAWDQQETADNTFSSSNDTTKSTERSTLASAGFGTHLTLATGIHNAPSYLSGVTNSRLVNENAGSSTGAVYDLVWNQLVRDKVERYWNHLQSVQNVVANYDAIRIQASDAELLYPGTGGTVSGSWWAYSAGAQSGTNIPVTQRVCPYPGWKPGQTTFGGNAFTATMAREWLEWYIDSLVDVASWQIRFWRALGFAKWFYILTPGVGTLQTGIAGETSGLLGTSGATTKVGAVWPWVYQRLVDRHQCVCYISSLADLSGSPINNQPTGTDGSVLLSDSTVNSWSSGRHLIRVGNEFSLPLAGENPGWGGFGDSHTSYYNATGTSDITTQLAYACRQFVVNGKLMHFAWAHDDVLQGSVSGATIRASDYKTIVIDPANGGTNPSQPSPP